jgi:hypothetical protein
VFLIYKKFAQHFLHYVPTDSSTLLPQVLHGFPAHSTPDLGLRPAFTPLCLFGNFFWII